MKQIFIGILISVFGLSVYANTVESVFQKNTVLPFEVQTKVFEELSLKCARGISIWGLTEMGSLLVSTHEEEFYTDAEYTIQFSSRYYFDGIHPSTQTLIVKLNHRNSWVPGLSEVAVKAIEGDCPQD